jgi:hypothetical protein
VLQKRKRRQIKKQTKKKFEMHENDEKINKNLALKNQLQTLCWSSNQRTHGGTQHSLHEQKSYRRW